MGFLEFHDVGFLEFHDVGFLNFMMWVLGIS